MIVSMERGLVLLGGFAQAALLVVVLGSLSLGLVSLGSGLRMMGAVRHRIESH